MSDSDRTCRRWMDPGEWSVKVKPSGRLGNGRRKASSICRMLRHRIVTGL